MIKIAAENWRQHGNILGTNEIMGIMFHRDLIVLGLSDGAMCAATIFGLGLQRLIFRGALSWNKQGWIIQSVCKYFAIENHLLLYEPWSWGVS